MTGFDILLLGFIVVFFVKDVGPKISGYFKIKKGGSLEIPIAPSISEMTRIISHGILTLMFLFLILRFEEADPLTIAFFITLVLMGIFPQPHGIYEKGLQAKGHFYRWEEIEEITVSRKAAYFRIKLKQKFRFDVTFSVSIKDRETLIEEIKEKPVKLEMEK